LEIGEVVYECSDCGVNTYQYWVVVNFDTATIQKVGQHPARDLRIPRDVAKLLESDAVALYRKGAMAEAHAFGIGAFAYYRRVVESITAKLLDRIENDAMAAEDRDRYKDVLDDIRREHTATERLKLAADVLPASLRPGGANPLSLLHESLSIGLHDSDASISDGECLEWAGLIRTQLTYLTSELVSHRERAVQYRESMEKLLSKRAERSRKADAASPSSRLEGNLESKT
jgi:hypothetical protein